MEARRRRIRSAVASVAFVLVIGAHALWYATDHANHARASNMEQYASSREFQLAAFAMFRLPIWLAVWGLVLLGIHGGRSKSA